MSRTRTLQVTIGLLIVALLGTTTVLIPYLLRQRQVAQQPIAPTDIQAWKTQQSANSACVNGKATIGVSFSNTEPADPIFGMKVAVNDLQTGKSVDLGIVPPGQTATGVIETGLDKINSGQVRFSLTWADGRPEQDTRFASYDAIECQKPAGLRISHLDCTELLVVYPDAPTGLTDTTGTCTLQRPNNTTVQVTTKWGGYDGQVAKWNAPVNDYYTAAGQYTINSCAIADRQVENLPFPASLNCRVATPTPTPPGPTSTPTVRPTQTPTPTPPPPTCRLTIKPKVRPTSTPTPPPGATSTPTPTATKTPTPTPTTPPGATATPTPRYACNTSCTSDAQCREAHPDYVCYSATLTCRHVNFPQREDCNSTQPSPGPTNTPTPQSTNTPTPKPTTIAAASPTPQPQLPSVGTTLPTIVLTSMGFLIIAGALLLLI